MKSNFAFDVFKLVGIAFMVLYLSKTYYDNTLAFHLPKSNHAKAKDAEEKKERLTKKRILLNKSFKEMMELGDFHMAENKYYDASKRYFDAKSIYPERFEPRIALCRSLMKLAERADYYLPATQKEIYYAFNYSHKTDNQQLVDELCQMDLDVVMIFDKAKSNFKYWDELMTIEDY